jgi:DNA-binding transcriptional MerR regulator
MERAPRGTDRVGYVRIEAAARLVGLQPARVRRYVQSGLISGTRDERGTTLLGAADLARLRKIRRLTSDIGLNPVGVELVMRLLDEIETLQSGAVRVEARREVRMVELPKPREQGRRAPQ